MQVTPSNIDNYAQNRPTLVARDLEEHGVPADVSYTIMLARGIFKWLSVRRKLIKLKNIWRNRITDTLQKMRDCKRGSLAHYYLKGYLRGVEQCREEVRELCHSSRYVAPDNDRWAQWWLEERE